MKGQPHRLVHDGQHTLGGAAIDRGRPLQFRLGDLTIHGFAGDTLLSAALANGIDTVGERDGAAIALSLTFSALVDAEGREDDAALPLDMARTPAVDGARYFLRALAHRGLAARIGSRIRRRSRSLGIDLDDARGLERPWLTAHPSSATTCDLVVVGGGVAGMAASVAAARAGLSVVLLEATPHAGGNARLFGTQEGEEAPADTIARLLAEIAVLPNIVFVLRAQAFAVRPGLVRVNVVQVNANGQAAEVRDFAAPRIVLATGALERLPIFSGNRLPRVTGVAEAHLLAHHYGVWQGRTAALATVSSPAYRLAMMARDAGIEVRRVLDGRTDPQSRFIAFSKAYGITMAPGMAIQSVQADKRGLSAQPHVTLEQGLREEPAFEVDRLLVCGGWQPDLTFWHMVGGQSVWNASTGRIEPVGPVAGVALAGSAAGHLSRAACLASGEAAVALLLGRSVDKVQDVLIDPMHETPDGPVPAAMAPEAGEPAAYLGFGHSFLALPSRQQSRWPAWIPLVKRQGGWELADVPHPLEIADITAGVQLGAIPPASAAIVAQERVAVMPLETVLSAPHPPSTPLPVPDYLRGRYGADGQLWLVTPTEPRRLETGALLYDSPDSRGGLAAIGVVVRAIEGGAVVLLSSRTAVAGATLKLRSHGRFSDIRTVAPWREGLDLAAALRSVPGAS